MENFDFYFVDLPAWKKGNLRYWSSAVYATFFEEKWQYDWLLWTSWRQFCNFKKSANQIFVQCKQTFRSFSGLAEIKYHVWQSLGGQFYSHYSNDHLYAIIQNSQHYFGILVKFLCKETHLLQRANLHSRIDKSKSWMGSLLNLNCAQLA